MLVLRFRTKEKQRISNTEVQAWENNFGQNGDKEGMIEFPKI